MRRDKRYVMIVTSEDERYKDGLSLSHFAEHPWEGLLVDIVYGNTFDELYGDGTNEGLFYQLYETGTGKRIGAGVLDPDGPSEEIKEWEKNNLTLQNFRPYTNNGKTIGRSIYSIFMSGNGWRLQELNSRPDAPSHAAVTDATFDLQEVLDRFNSITEELELINDPLCEGGII